MAGMLSRKFRYCAAAAPAGSPSQPPAVPQPRRSRSVKGSLFQGEQQRGDGREVGGKDSSGQRRERLRNQAPAARAEGPLGPAGQRVP